jgi:hypothetical protein
MEFLRKGILTKRQTVNGQNQELVTTELNPEHPLVLEALPEYDDGVVRESSQDLAYDEFDEELDELYSDDYDDDAYDEAPAEDEDNRGNLISPEERVARAHVDS